MGCLTAMLAILLVAAPARAALIAQIGRCIAPAENKVEDPPGFGNQPSTRKLKLSFAYALPGGTPEPDEIAATNRVEVCHAKPVSSGMVTQVTCPGGAWIVFDRTAPVGSLPAAGQGRIKPDASLPADNKDAEKGKLFEVLLPVDWDDPSWRNAILFMVVNAPSKPTTLASVASAINAGGFCGVENRIGTAGLGVAPAPSDPGATTPENITHVLYGVPDSFKPASDWTFGSVCSSSNKAGFGGWNPVCIDSNAGLFGLMLLTRVDQWQQSTVEAGLGSDALPTWWNGPGGGSTTCGGATCPTRTFWQPAFQGGGYGYGGSFCAPADDYGSRLDLFDPNVSSTSPASLRRVLNRHNGILRGQSHEYFHGLVETWARSSGSDLFTLEMVNESVATSAEWAACLTSYPTIKTLNILAGEDFTLRPDRCISAESLYGPFYGSGGLTEGNKYLQFPESPLNPYMGALFYRYVAEQFAHPPNSLSNRSSHSSASPVRFDASNNELPLGQRRPDEGMDLIGYFLASLDSKTPISLPCNQSLPK
jgi:hypothetical protein